MAHNFHAHLQHSDCVSVRGRKELLAAYKATTEADPEYRIDILSINACLADEGCASAAVWMLLGVSGYPPSIRKEIVAIVHWREWNGEWCCLKEEGICGIGTGGER